MNCTRCPHPAHGEDACTHCTLAGTTCWQKIHVTGGDGDTSAAGKLAMAHGLEIQPCMTCRHWDGVQPERVVQYLMSRKLKPQADGTFITPIAQEVRCHTCEGTGKLAAEGEPTCESCRGSGKRKSLVLDPRDYGWCRTDGMITDALATCENWQPTKDMLDFQRKMRG